MHHFCTYFDHRYLSRGIALYQSLERHCPEFCLWVLGLSKECCAALSQCAFDRMKVVALEELESKDNGLVRAKKNRNLVEYYFTLTPSFPSYLFERYKSIDFLTYVDADCCFFADPAPVFKEIGENAVAIIGHRFSPHLVQREKYGKYNVSWLSFRRNQQGLACLDWYREKCLDWCHDYLDGERFADQKYLDQFEKLFSSVHVLMHKGANLAPWNVSNYALTVRNDIILVDDQPLIFYHFHGLKRLLGPLFNSGFASYQTKLTPFIKEHIYQNYLAELQKIQKEYLSHVVVSPILDRIHEKPESVVARKGYGNMHELFENASNLIRVLKANTSLLARPRKTTA